MGSDSANKALKSGVWYTVANFITKGLVFITTPIFTRLLTHEQFGDFNNYTSWLSILTIICTLNLESTFISARFEYENRFDEFVFSMLALSTISTLLSGIIINVAYPLTKDIFMIDRWAINILFVYLLFNTAVHMYQTRERFCFGYKQTVFITLVVSVFTVGLSLILVYFSEDRLAGRILGHTVPTIIVGLVLYVKLMRQGRKIDHMFWKYALPIALPYIPHLLSLSLLNSMDKIQIKKFCGSNDNALYSLAYTCGAIVSILLVSMNNAYAPWLGEKLNQNNYYAIRKFSKTYILLFFVGLIGIMLLSPEFLLFMGGRSYSNAKYVMPPIAFSCGCQFIYTMFVNVEQFKKKTIGMAIGSISAAVLNFVLNILFIPKYGYIAAAYTTLASFLWLLIVHMIVIKIIKEDKVYDYKFISCIIVAMFICTIAVNYLYKKDVARFLFLFMYFVIVIVLLYNNRGKLIPIVKLIFTKKG